MGGATIKFNICPHHGSIIFGFFGFFAFYLMFFAFSLSPLCFFCFFCFLCGFFEVHASQRPSLLPWSFPGVVWGSLGSPLGFGFFAFFAFWSGWSVLVSSGSLPLWSGWGETLLGRPKLPRLIKLTSEMLEGLGLYGVVFCLLLLVLLEDMGFMLGPVGA